MVGRSLSEDERSAELLAVVRGLQAFYSSHARKAVFPDLSDKLVYGDYNVAGTRGHQLLETVTAEINACAHVKSGSWPCKKVESVRRHYVGKIRADVGRENEAAFEAYARALEQTRPEAASGSAPLMQRPAEEAADMAVDASPAPLGERPATAHNAGASAASAEAGCTSAGCEEEAAAAEADAAQSGERGYEGEFNTLRPPGEYEGRGVERFASGDVYEGEYKAGKKEGRRRLPVGQRQPLRGRVQGGQEGGARRLPVGRWTRLRGRVEGGQAGGARRHAVRQRRRLRGRVQGG